MAKSPIYNREGRDWNKIILVAAVILALGAALYFAYFSQDSKLQVPYDEGVARQGDIPGLFLGEVPPGHDTDEDGFPDEQERESGSDPQDPYSLPTDSGGYEPLSQVDVNEDGDFDITVTKAVNGISSVIIEHYGDFEEIEAGVGEVTVSNFGSANSDGEIGDPLAQDSFRIEELQDREKVVKYISPAQINDIIVVSLVPIPE